MMICRHSGFSNEKATTSDKLFVSVNPYVEVLPRFIAGEIDVHALDNPASFRR